MFQQMFTGIDGEGPFGGQGATGVWRSLLTDEYAKSFAKAGGIGIADHVYRSPDRPPGDASMSAPSPQSPIASVGEAEQAIENLEQDHGPAGGDGRGRDRARARRPAARRRRAR